jgi:hypothetical protein
VFGNKGPAIFVPADDEDALLSILAILNSLVFQYLLSLQVARVELAQSFEVGLVQRTPLPALSKIEQRELSALARRQWSLRRILDTVNETSHAFVLPPGLNERVTDWDRATVEEELTSLQKRIDEAVFQLYGITSKDRTIIETVPKSTVANDREMEDIDERDNDTVASEEPAGPASDMVTSWIVGVCFGRFDIRLAMGEHGIPPEPGPFDPLALVSPGMLPASPEALGCPDILVDDEGHSEDLVARVHAVAERVAVELSQNVRTWLAREFFPLHIRMYSKSRRKAPIYWQLATPSVSYSVWLYIDALSKDTLFRAQNDYAAPKLAHEERRLDSLTRELRDKATAAQRRELAAQEVFVQELRAFLEEVRRVAPLWNPNLDDGVIINFAPLWRLVPHHKPWQKELKSTWDALYVGEYDWAHLAMHLWPERVVPKCARDRSLAIAHGLEDVFWAEGSDGKWTARKTPTRTIDDLVRERTSPAVKSALKSLLEAPAANGNTGRVHGARRQSPAAVAGGEV